MPRGRRLPARAARRAAEEAIQGARPRRRQPNREVDQPPEELVHNRVGEADQGNIIDFEHIVQDGNIQPQCNVAAQTTTDLLGCGSDPTNLGSGLNLNVLAQTVAYSQFRLADDDLTVHIPASLKQKICRGDYVNLALMLKGAVELSEITSSTSLRISNEGNIETTPKECKDKLTSIEKWTNAFILYCSIYLSNHADKVYEMLHYMFNIRECAFRQGGLGWATYDEQFRLRQAIHPTSWAKINNELWWRCIQMPQRRDNQSFPFRSICYSFNQGNCTWQNCKFRHVCSNCYQQHPASRCPTSTSDNSNEIRNTNNFRGRFQRYRGQARGNTKK